MFKLIAWLDFSSYLLSFQGRPFAKCLLKTPVFLNVKVTRESPVFSEFFFLHFFFFHFLTPKCVHMSDLKSIRASTSAKSLSSPTVSAGPHIRQRADGLTWVDGPCYTWDKTSLFTQHASCFQVVHDSIKALLILYCETDDAVTSQHTTVLWLQCEMTKCYIHITHSYCPSLTTSRAF